MSSPPTDEHIKIRRALPEDYEDILSLSKLKLVEDNRIDEFSLDVETLRKDGFGKDRIFHCLLAVIDLDISKQINNETLIHVSEQHNDGDHEKTNRTYEKQDDAKRDRGESIVGFALYVYHYSEYDRLYPLMDTLYVLPTYRDRKIATQLVREIAKDALQSGCRRLDWIFDHWHKYKTMFEVPKGTKSRTACFQLCVDGFKHSTAPKVATQTDGIIIRKARIEDCEDIISLMRGQAMFELQDPTRVTIDAGTLRRDGFESLALFHCYVAEDQCAGGAVIGHTMHVLHYSPIDGVSLFLEDFYVSSEYRRRGVGSRLFQVVAKEAAERGFKRLRFLCHSWNKGALRFYAAHGALNCTEAMGSHYFTLFDDSLRACVAK